MTGTHSISHPPGIVYWLFKLDSIILMWEWLSPGGLPGLQNLWRVALRAAVGSTPIHSRFRILIEISRMLQFFILQIEVLHAYS